MLKPTLRSLAVAATIAGAASGPLSAEPVDVTQTPVPMQEGSERNELRNLIYRGGVHLTSRDGRFGGFSGLGVSQDGRRMVSVTDGGMSLSADITYDADGNLTGVANPDLGTLADLDGERLAGKRWSDAEAMSPGVTGEILIAFERDHRIWRYDPGQTAPKILRPPEELADMPANAGIEALTLLNDGRLLAISEGSPREDSAVGWVSRADGWDVLTYNTSDGFRATGAATLPNGDVLMLERFYTPRAGVRIRIKKVPSGVISAGAEIDGELIAELAPPLSVDNFEGIEARQGRNGETLVYLISDDNFNADQRTLLMMFEMR